MKPVANLAGPRNWFADWPVLLFMLIGATFALGAIQFKGGGGLFPLTTGALVVVLCLLESIWHPIGSFEGSESDSGGSKEDGPCLRLDLISLSWITVSIAACYFLGMLVGIAIGTAIYLWAIVNVRPHWSVMGGLALTFSLWFLLGQLAGFRFHPGTIW